MNDVELERQKLIEQKRAGEYDLFEHLDNHPVAGLVKRGIRLPDEHPLSKLKNKQCYLGVTEAQTPD